MAFRVYYVADPARVTEPAEFVGQFDRESDARKACRESVGRNRCDNDFYPACAGENLITGAHDGSEGGPFAWVELDD